jgi:hypothetical protein
MGNQSARQRQPPTVIIRHKIPSKIELFQAGRIARANNQIILYTLNVDELSKDVLRHYASQPPGAYFVY